MLRRSFLCLAMAGLIAFPDFVRAEGKAADEPTLVVRVRSIDGLLGDVKYLATLGGKEKDAKKLDEQLKAALPKGFEGIDTKRPIGLYGRLEEVITDSTAVLLVPVSDEKAFVGLLENVTKQKLKKDDDGTYSFSPGNDGQTVYIRFANKYAYASLMHKEPLEKNKLRDPEKLLGAGDATIFISFRLDHIPDALKQIGLGQMENRLADLEEQKQPNETKAQEALRKQTTKEVTAGFSSLIKEGAEIALKFDVDHNANQLVVEASVAGKEASKLAAGIAKIAGSKSLFGGLFGNDSAMKILVHGALPPGMRATFESAVDEGLHKELDKEKDKAKREQAEKILKVLGPTLKSGDLDLAIDLRGPSANKLYAVVAALKIKDGGEIDKLIRDVVKDVPAKDREDLKLDAESAAGLKIHQLDIGKKLDAEARRLLGDNPVYFAIRNDALFVAAGENGLAAIKEAASASPKAAPPVSLEFAISRLVALMEKSPKGDPKAAAQKAFAGNSNDKIHVAFEGGKSLKLRLDISGAVVQFFNLLEKKDAN